MFILRTLLLTLFVGFSFSIFSQDLILNYTEPDALVVCDNNDFTFTMTNASPDTLKNVMVTASLPTGLNYVAGSITVGSESNITIPNAPVFSFGNIPPFQTIEFTIGTNLECALVNEINTGVLFTNTLNATWEGGNNTLTTIPYVIETPLLVITAVTNTFLSGTQGSIVSRTITIQNTRLGALSSFNFSDFHDGGIVITSALGTVINSTATSWEIELTANDFMTIGDGDGLFEQDEVIVITEEIEIVDCGIDLLFTNSDYTISWGCFGELCQMEQNNATVDLIPNDGNSNLFIEGFSNMPYDFCGGEVVQQGVWIKNQGTSAAIDVSFILGGLPFGIDIIRAFDPLSIVQDSNGVVTNISPPISNPAPTDVCDFPSGLFQQANFFWESFPAGDSILLTWDIYFCNTAPECSQVFPSINMSYDYINDCPLDTITGGVNLEDSNRDSLLNELLKDSIYYFFGQPLLDGLTYPMEYHVISNRLTQPGVLDLEFELPCNFSWVNSDLMMGGQLPNNIDVTTNGSMTTVHAQYDLPMDSTRVMTILEVAFGCDPACGAGVGSCVEPYITATGDVGCGTFQELNVKVNLRKDNTIPFECGQETCSKIELLVDCPGDGFPGDFAYLILDHEFERCNFDLPDNDDDRLADASGELDFNLVRKDRAIPGDTVTNIFSSQFDFPNGEFPIDLDKMSVQFEAHSMDNGIDGGVFMDAFWNDGLLKNGGIQPLNAQIRIVDNSTGDVYECDLPTSPAFQGVLDEFFNIVNTEPLIPIDNVYYNKFTYNTAIADIPCLPSGFQYGQGDSLIFTTKHRMVYNPVPQDSAGLPPVLNMRSAVVPIFCDQFNPYISRIPRFFTSFQYSGYKYEILSGRYISSLCETFDGPTDMRLRFTLGMDNFFPYEYRPLASLDDWKLTFPNGISVLDSELGYLRYWEGNEIIPSQDLMFSQQGNTFDFQVEQWHDPVLDESWEMSFYHEFDADCTFSEFNSLLIESQMTLNECLPEPSVVNLTRSDTSFISGNPNLNIGVNVACFYGFDNQANWDFALLNSEGNTDNAAENVWVEIVSPTGLVTNFEISEISTGTVLSQTNGIFQLGTLDVNQLKNYKLTATNNSCDTETLELRYGWNCTPYSEGGDSPCLNKMVFIKAESPGGELEMEVTSPAGPFDLCEVIDYHTVEIFNAQLGNVYDVFLEITMPQGLSLVPNSTQLAYPTGGTFVDVADPTNVAGNVFEWNISELNSTIQASGLGSVSNSPDNSVSLRFLTNTDCGFIAGARIIFKTKGQQNCPDPTNILSKSSDPVEITGINPLYSSDINIAFPNPVEVTCDVTVPLNINILPGGTTSNSDSVFINLPPGVSYVSGSYNPINNAPTNPPTVFDNGGQQILKLKIDAGVTAGTLISFEIQTVGYGENGCDNQVVQVQAVQRQDAVCSATGELCYVLAETGSGTINVETVHPELFLQNLEIMGMGSSVNFDVVIGNSGIPNAADIQVDFYIDMDGDGTLSVGDVLVGNGIYQGTVGTNETVNFEGAINLSPDQLCNLIAVIDEGNNCVCSTVTIPVNFPMSSMLDNVVVCSGAPTEIGFVAATGHTYSWSPPGGNITTTNTATTTFQASNTSLQDTLFYNYSILDNNGNGCEISHELEVAVLPIPMILQQDVEICAGETITLFATEGGTYNWQGPNISNPNQASQTVTLFENSTYTVDISLPPGCDGMDEINVSVIPLTVESSSEEKCPDEQIFILGQNITEPGTYCDTISTLNGCDSVICVEVSNFLSNTQTTQAVCPGDSVVIDSVTYFPPEVICNTMISSFGCDSTHCITLEYVEEPFAEFVGIDAEIFVAENEETQLEVTSGFANYEWFPTTGLSCTDCHNPTTTLGPEEGLEYRVTITDDNGCSTQLFLLVTVLPPCSPTRLRIPNAFTPDGDGVNDKFGVPEFEGFEMVSSIRVFDRWGEKVYQGTGEDAFWDGTIDGKPGTSDVYVYIIRIICDEGEGLLHGDVTLIR